MNARSSCAAGLTPLGYTRYPEIPIIQDEREGATMSKSFISADCCCLSLGVQPVTCIQHACRSERTTKLGKACATTEETQKWSVDCCCLCLGVQSVSCVQHACWSDKTTKLRKPYTSTKLRAKWTDEEHHKFLEALKLYGRGWPQITRVVGTKTAIQIRSHAQKFFTKLRRSGDDKGSSVELQMTYPPPTSRKCRIHYPRNSLIIREENEYISKNSMAKEEKEPSSWLQLSIGSSFKNPSLHETK